MKSICVFCGSSPGVSPAYQAAATALGRLMGKRGITLVYGGGTLGLMGAVAAGVTAEGGQVVGVIPRLLLEREAGGKTYPNTHVVETMHERKAKMAELSDAFAVLPGGIGTMEEFFEVWSWAQLGFHDKPFGVLEVEGYWSGLFAFLDRMVSQGFVRDPHRQLVQLADDPESLLALLSKPSANPGVKNLDRI